MTNRGPDPSPFCMEGGPVGCLLIHGFTGSPPEMRLLGDYLSERDVTVSAPLLAGHGTVPGDLNRVRWGDWVASAAEALLGLLSRCDSVFLAGLSMGALVAIHLAVGYPETAGIVLYSPALVAANRFLVLAPIIRHVIKQFPGSGDPDLTDPDAEGRLWHYGTYPVGGAAELLTLQRVVRTEVGDVRAPAIVFRSKRDTMIHPDSARLTYDGLGSDDKELVTLHNSGHCMTVDAEREAIFARTYGFIVGHS